MRILFVGMVDSIHVKRWLDNICDQGWELHLFSVYGRSVCKGYRNVVLQDIAYDRPRRELEQVDPSVRFDGMYWPVLKHLKKQPGFGAALIRIMPRLIPKWKERAWRLAKTIQRLKPDIIHSMEFQHACYMTLEARTILAQEVPHFRFPTWIVSNWGSDIYLFGHFPEHAEKIRAILAQAAYYLCECQRDVLLGEEFGFKGEILPLIPVAGGHNLQHMTELRAPGLPANRKLIVLKGYQNWAGRALVALRALELCADLLNETHYEIAIYLYDTDVKLAAELMAERTGIPIRFIPYGPHDEILKAHGQARISIGLSISDAISTSFLEALMMGSFPIQSDTSCCNEWIEHGKTGLIVPPEDPEAIASAIRQALTDDELVNRAVELNDQTVKARLDYAVVQARIIHMYQHVMSEIQS